jgi:hypothetical protein
MNHTLYSFIRESLIQVTRVGCLNNRAKSGGRCLESRSPFSLSISGKDAQAGPEFLEH